MAKQNLKLFNVIDQSELPMITVNRTPQDGDPVEVDGEMYYVCENNPDKEEGSNKIGVIPLVVKNPAKVQNIKHYIDCLTIAHRRVLFMKGENICDLDGCDEMHIS